MLTFIYITYLLGVKGIVEHFGKCPYYLNPPECPVHVAALNMHFFFQYVWSECMCLEYNSVSYVLRTFFFQEVLNVQITAYLDLVSTRKGLDIFWSKRPL